MKCEDCKNISNCKDKADNPKFGGCTTGIPSNPIIKPCPFCGKEAYLIKNTCEKNNFTSYRIYHYCHAIRHSIKTELMDLEEGAIAIWNRRA